MGRSRWVVAGLVVLLALSGYGALDVADVVPGVLTRTDNATIPTAATGARPASVTFPQPGDPNHAPLAPLATDAPAPSRAGVQTALAPLLKDPKLGPSLALDVRDVRTGQTLFAQDATRPRIPASSAKLLTATALAAEFDLRTTMRTRVVSGDQPDAIVLVAGGDTLLSPVAGKPDEVVGHAGVGDLAGQVADQLRARGQTQVSLGVDLSLAAGAPYGPGWQPADVKAGYTAPISMLGLASSRAKPGRPSDPDPAGTAVAAFATQLGRHGIRVAGKATSQPAPAGAVELGSVESASNSEVLTLALADSDNALIEGVARRLAAQAGVSTAFPAVTDWILRELSDLQIPMDGVVLRDTSGLAAGSRVPASVLAEVLVKAATSEDEELTAVVAKLPVAGLSGTLHDRYRDARSHAGAGLVRAKTGTLTGTAALAGTVVDADGRLLVFVAMADRVPISGTVGARVALDRVTTALAGCGCR